MEKGKRYIVVDGPYFGRIGRLVTLTRNNAVLQVEATKAEIAHAMATDPSLRPSEVRVQIVVNKGKVVEHGE